MSLFWQSVGGRGSRCARPLARRRDGVAGVRAIAAELNACGILTPADEFEQQIGMAVGEGQVADLVDDQQAGACVTMMRQSRDAAKP